MRRWRVTSEEYEHYVYAMALPKTFGGEGMTRARFEIAFKRSRFDAIGKSEIGHKPPRAIL
jgi:hypothetical protein